MNKIIKMEDIGFHISWKLIEIGLYGYSCMNQQLTKEEVCQYFDERLLQEDEETDNIVKLVLEQDDDDNFKKMLQYLATTEKSDINIQFRKWRIFLLIDILENISKDYVQGLLSLTEFWSSMNFPDDSPHVYQTNSTQKYYTQYMYDFLVEKNRQWVKNEKEFINSTEAQ